MTVATIASWVRRLDEGGEDALVAVPVPVNRFPDYVADLVRRMRTSFPALGTKRIADMLARARVHVARSTVGRMLEKRDRPKKPPTPKQKDVAQQERIVAATDVHELWHIDLTILPTVSGWWAPWFPFALLQRWPFCFWLGAVLDHVSRSAVAWKLFAAQPDGNGIVELLEVARQNAGRAPRHIVSDRGVQFQGAYVAWCERYGVRPRYGAVGKHGSIAVLERFWPSLKSEMLRRRRIVPMAMPVIAQEIWAYIAWYQQHRPHQGLGGKTPREVLEGGVAARDRQRLETRRHWPLSRGDPAPLVARRVEGVLVLDVQLAKGREHLPIVRVREPRSEELAGRERPR